MTNLYLNSSLDTFESKLNHMNFLLREIKILRERIEEYDTGYIVTTINTLEQRVHEIQNEMISERDK
tara:strand:+ start:500 stop:700 length:201 start_codon:yes stop_codon:yes gene_type:complete